MERVPTRSPTRRRHPLRRRSASRVVADAVLTIDDLVEYLKLPKSTVYKLCQEGKIPGQKVGRHWRFHRDRIDAWLIGSKAERRAK